MFRLLVQLLSLIAIFQVNPGQPHFHSSSSPPSMKKSLRGLMERKFLRPSCHPTDSVKAQNGTNNTNPNQWPHPSLSSSIAGRPMEEVLLPLCRLSALICGSRTNPRVAMNRFNEKFKDKSRSYREGQTPAACVQERSCDS